MKKLTLIVSSLLLVSFSLSHTSYSGIVKSKQPNNPTGIEINIHSDVDVYGVQFDLSYDSDNLLLKSKDNIKSLVESVTVYSKIIEPGMARVIMFSMQGDKIFSSSDDIASIIDVEFDTVVNNFKGEATVSISNLILAGANGVAVEAESSSNGVVVAGIPAETSLEKNYPNPFNPSTTIPVKLSEAGYVTLKVYDMSGSLVKTLASDYRDAGSYDVIWNGLNNDGQKVASGQYILQMSAPNYNKTQQMTFLK